MKIESLITFLPCTDLAKTTAFYHDFLGLEYDVQAKDKVHIFDVGYGYLGFVQYDDGRKPLSGDHGVCISLNLQSRQAIDDLYESLKQTNVTITQKPLMHKTFPVYSMFIEDPDGYKVEFQKIIDKGE